MAGEEFEILRTTNVFFSHDKLRLQFIAVYMCL